MLLKFGFSHPCFKHEHIIDFLLTGYIKILDLLRIINLEAHGFFK